MIRVFAIVGALEGFAAALACNALGAAPVQAFYIFPLFAAAIYALGGWFIDRCCE